MNAAVAHAHIDITEQFEAGDWAEIERRPPLSGLGLAYLPLDQVNQHLESGRLIRVLGEWTPPLPGYHLYYPSRRHASPAFKLLVNALRYRT